MNRQDIILAIIIFILGISFLLVTKLIALDNPSKADVYYDSKKILTIDLSISKAKKYTVKGYNGDVVIEADKYKIRVIKETSPLHLCSKQGWINSSLQTIVCLPNKIIIKIVSTNEQVDAVIR